MILFIMFFNNKIIPSNFFELKNYDEEFNCLPCIYWPSKMHKIPSSAKFITAGKKCVNKELR